LRQFPREIAEMYEADVKTVCGRIKNVVDRVVTGKVAIMNPTQEEIEAAQARIDQKAQTDAEYKKEQKGTGSLCLK
jgi:hypothetical protein